MFLAPVGYSLAELSPTPRVLVDLNPLTGIIEACRWMVLSGYQPSVEPIAVSLVGDRLLAARRLAAVLQARDHDGRRHLMADAHSSDGPRPVAVAGQRPAKALPPRRAPEPAADRARA